MKLEIKVSNRDSRPRRFCLEPWADEVMLEPGKSLLVLVTSSTPPELELELVTDGQVMAVHGPLDAHAEIVGM
jgi:hypothetical protein